MAETEVVKKEDNRVLVTDYSKGIFGTSDNFTMAYQMAKALASSTIVPSTYQKNPSNCLIAIEQAQRLGVSPMMVMQNLYVIQGRPSWSSKFLIAAINNSGKYDMELQFDLKRDKSGKAVSCVAWTEKDGRRIEGMTVTMEMAQAEGWLSKNGSKWKTMPELMLRYRAASFFSSLNCPEITMGIYTQEEIVDGTFSENLDNVVASTEEEVNEQTATEVIDIEQPQPQPEQIEEKTEKKPIGDGEQAVMPGF